MCAMKGVVTSSTRQAEQYVVARISIDEMPRWRHENPRVGKGVGHI